MKKTLLTLCLAVAWYGVFAQYYNSYSPVTFGVKAGANLSVIRETNNIVSGAAESGSLLSFRVGGFADFKMSDEFSIQPSLLFLAKGGKQNLDFGISDPDVGEIGATANVKTTIFYAQVPVDFLYHFYNDYGELFIGGGPYLAYAIKGKSKGTASINMGGESISQPYEQDVQFGNNEGQLKRMDYGINAVVGYKFDNGFLVNASYDFGLATAASSSVPDFNYELKDRIRSFSLCIGYAF